MKDMGDGDEADESEERQEFRETMINHTIKKKQRDAKKSRRA